jgi:glutathione reductase (NADPH)
MTFDYDLFVIGAGSGGLAAAERAAAYGAHVAISEREQVGGTCVIHGCIPEKLMSYAASFSHFLQDADEYGWGKVSDKFDWDKFISSMNRDINHLSQLHIQHLQQAGVELIYGNTKFLDAHTIDVGGRRITAEKILIAVGAKTVKPEIPGIEHAITLRDMFQLKQQPKHLAIIGSDHLAVKFAGIMNALVSKVTQVVFEDNILPGRDEELRTALQERMTKDGIHVLCKARVDKIELVQDVFTLKLSGKSQENLTVDTILCATGRFPNLSGLNLENAGVEVNLGRMALK